MLGLWEPDADAPILVGLRYRPGQPPVLTREWTSDAVGGGPLASPVLSADGSTAYVNGRDERLWAINTADGKPKWSVPLDYLAQTPPSVSPDGLIVAGGGPEAKLVGIKDGGDRGEVEWTRDDVAPLTTVEPIGCRRGVHRGARRRERSGAARVRSGRRPHGQHLPAAQCGRLARWRVRRP